MTGPGDAAAFVEARISEGATHLKVSYDDGSSAMMDVASLDVASLDVASLDVASLDVASLDVASLDVASLDVASLDVASLDVATIEALVTAARQHGIPVVAQVSTAAGAVTVARCGVDPLAHVPFDRMSDADVRDVARSGVALIATLSIIDGFPGPDGVRPRDALTAATAAPAAVFGLTDRGRLRVGNRADLVLVDGDPTASITATQNLRHVWVGGHQATPAAYAGSAIEREGIGWLRESTDKIVTAIHDLWPGFPGPEEVRRDDGELLGRIIPTRGGWRAVTTFGAAWGEVTTHDDALEIACTLGLSSLADPWWMRPIEETDWREVQLMEVQPGRVRVRWADRMVDQPASGQWFGLDDVDLAHQRPAAGEGSTVRG